MKKPEKRVYKILSYILMTIILFGLTYQYSAKIRILSEKKKLKESDTKKVVNGIIHQITKVQRSARRTISYEFIYQGKKYHRRIQDVFHFHCKFDYSDRVFPIIIDSLSPEKNFILFHKRDYKYFGYLVPDSMNWVFDCVEPAGQFYLTPAPISPD